MRLMVEHFVLPVAVSREEYEQRLHAAVRTIPVAAYDEFLAETALDDPIAHVRVEDKYALVEQVIVDVFTSLTGLDVAAFEHKGDGIYIALAGSDAYGRMWLFGWLPDALFVAAELPREVS